VKHFAAIMFLVVPCVWFFGCGRPAGEQSPGGAEVATPAAEPAAEPDTAAEAKDTAAKPAQGESPNKSKLDELSVEELLSEVIKAKNPGFRGEVGIRSDEQGIVRVVALNDAAIEDISPLKDIPLAAVDLRGCHIDDISALKGAPLQEVFLEDTAVEDISPLKGAPIRKLYLSNAPVEDISPLKGMPLKELNIIGTKVRDLGPLKGMGVAMLWLSDCPVEDISPLAKTRLVSLTAARTKISDISPLKGHPTLERLHIAGTAVTDLTPLRWMKLTRLIFTPGRIKKGIDDARAMPTLREIDTEFGEPGTRRRPMTPAEFWPLYDAGEFK